LKVFESSSVEAGERKDFEADYNRKRFAEKRWEKISHCESSAHTKRLASQAGADLVQKAASVSLCARGKACAAIALSNN
jgi:hypothetical protein